MGQILPPSPVLRFCAIFSQQAEHLQWARQRLTEAWGPIALASPEWLFTQTAYYTATMGAELRKQLLAFETLQSAEFLPTWKRQANEWEETLAGQGGHGMPRPVNIDPGYVTLAKLVLATTKDRDHRLYLGQGIFGEVTLHYKHGAWRADRWTYADYQSPEYHEFLNRCRHLLKEKLKNAPA